MCDGVPARLTPTPAAEVATELDAALEGPRAGGGRVVGVPVGVEGQQLCVHLLDGAGKGVHVAAGGGFNLPLGGEELVLAAGGGEGSSLAACK